MSYGPPKAGYAQFSKDPNAYKQYTPDDPVKGSIYDINFHNSSSLDYQNKSILLIDSKDRKSTEEPNKYVIHLKKEYRDVVCIELQNADIPNSNYVLHEFNNNFYFQDSSQQVLDGTFHTIRLPIGNFPIDDPCDDSIRSLLQDALNMINTNNKYTVFVDSNQNTFTIRQDSGSNIFNILFHHPICCQGSIKLDSNPLKGNIGELLGFKTHNNKTDSLTYTGEYTYNLYPAKYIILKIRELQRINSNHDPAQDAFVIIPRDTRINNFNLGNNCDQIDNEVFKYYFESPISHFDRLTIEFLDEDGNPYNFRGHNHFLIFEITTLANRKVYH